MSQEQIEDAIRIVLTQETTALGISDKLFTPDGLFSLLASSEDERRKLVKTPLFQQAQKRFRELQFKEAEAFEVAASSMNDPDLNMDYALKLERITN